MLFFFVFFYKICIINIGDVVKRVYVSFSMKGSILDKDLCAKTKKIFKEKRMWGKENQSYCLEITFDSSVLTKTNINACIKEFSFDFPKNSIFETSKEVLRIAVSSIVQGMEPYLISFSMSF